MTGRSGLKTLRVIGVYAALAAGVTLGGVVIGATVVAPAVGVSAFERTSAVVGSVPEIMWMYAGAGAVVALVAALGWRWWSLRARTPGAPVRRATALPVKLASEKSHRTPSAVMALAASGASPSDIARRTGLSVDAVAMCLSIGA